MELVKVHAFLYILQLNMSQSAMENRPYRLIPLNKTGIKDILKTNLSWQ